MSRSLWLVFAGAALWLWASLVPQVTYSTASSGEPTGDVLIVWPEWAVQQDLGPLNGTIGRFQIWVSSALDGGEITLEASLVDASTNEVLRQTTIDATPSYTPVARSLAFPNYDVPEGRRLLLQLQVAAFERRHVVLGLAHAQSEYSNLAQNGVPDVGSGPLAFSNEVTSTGLRAALGANPDERNRLISALVLTGLAALGHPRIGVWAALRRVAAAARRLARQAAIRQRRLAGPKRQLNAKGVTSGRDLVLAVPWYPWPAALAPVLHFLASNPLHFSVGEALAPGAGVLLLVTVVLGCLRLLVTSWHSAAAAVAGVTAVVFGYGHVDQALDGRLDDRTLFPAAVVLASVLLGIAVQNQDSAARWTPFLNLTAGVLLVFQIIGLLGASPGTTVRAPQLFAQTTQEVSGDRPDVYYIILDAYGRNDVLGEYDNSSFLEALEERGFYVAREATSNYMDTIESLASSLNLDYLHDIKPRPPENRSDAIALVQNNALAATFKSLGYTYVHLESGSVISSQAPQANIFVTFTPAGIIVSGAETNTRYSSTARSTQTAGVRESGLFRALIETTALRPLTGNRFSPGGDSPYDWWSPERALQMFAFLSEPIETPGPKYVFAHILKPHSPATFDRHGNMLISERDEDEFSDAHDLTVPDAYIGQLIYINSLVLKLIDRILENSDEKPIIVIAADHARGNPNKNHILAAFHLPHGGVEVLYPSISSVNHFRAIMDYYFGLNLGLLDDVTLANNGNQLELSDEATAAAAAR